jgi:S1-C subfamily serine protease
MRCLEKRGALLSISLAFGLAFLLAQQYPAVGQEVKPQELYQKLLPSIATLSVEERDGSFAIGSAFMGVKDGLAVTAWHVVENAKHVTAKFSSGEEFDVSGLIDKDEKRDVALIKIKVFGRPALPLEASDPPVGSKTYIIGAPQGLEFSITEGLLSQIQNMDGIKYYQFSCPTSPGNSGGPLVDEKGKVRGVVSWQLRDGQNLNFAIPAAYVLGLDATLPTKPWESVKVDSPPAASLVTPEKADALLADSLLCVYDANTSMAGTLALLKQPAFTPKTNILGEKEVGTWLLQTPVYLFQSQARLTKQLDLLTPLVLTESRGKFREQLIKEMKSYLATIQDLMDLIKTVQNEQSWNKKSMEHYNKTIALLPDDTALDPAVLNEVAKSIDFMNEIPPDAQFMLGLANHSDWFPISVQCFTHNPLYFLVVRDGGVADKLGFKSGDILLRYGDQKAVSLLAFKSFLKENSGKEVEVVVWREEKEKNFKTKIPKELNIQ